jgi:hypothetical protein
LSISTALDYKIGIYPNPAIGSFVIDIDKAAVDMTYTMYALDGKVVNKGDLTNQISKIDITSLTRNTYTIQIMEKGKVVYKGEVVVE